MLLLSSTVLYNRATETLVATVKRMPTSLLAQQTTDPRPVPVSIYKRKPASKVRSRRERERDSSSILGRCTFDGQSLKKTGTVE